VFSSAGTYTVTATITSNNAQQTATTEIVIFPPPTAVVPTVDLTKCADSTGNTIFNLLEFNDVILDEQDTSDFSVSYFASQEDLESNTPIAVPNEFTTDGQTIYVQVLNETAGCFTTIQFDLEVLDAPVIAEVEFTGCAPFDLEAITADSSTGFTFKFYTTEEDAQNQINAINNPNQYDFTGNETTLYIEAENQEGCSAIAPFQLYKGSCEIQKGISPNG